MSTIRRFAIKARNVLRYGTYILDYQIFKKSHDNRFRLSIFTGKACLNEKTSKTGFDRHYIYHVAWAARVLAETKPNRHTDISSSLYFSSIVSAFMPVDFYDYRPAQLDLPNLISHHADLNSLPFADSSLASLSCMHTVEHVGLGRYGDQINPQGDLKAMSELSRVLAHGGDLLFVVPIGKPKIVFNAHRIYSYNQIIASFPNLRLKRFSLIPENPQNGGLIVEASEELANRQNYGCGCFWFTKD